MKALGLILALRAQRARGANIPGRNQPHAGQRHCRVGNQAPDDLSQDAVDRRFRGLRPNLMIGGVEGVAERQWSGAILRLPEAEIGPA